MEENALASFIYDVHEEGGHEIFGNFADGCGWFWGRKRGIFPALWTSACMKNTSFFIIICQFFLHFFGF